MKNTNRNNNKNNTNTSIAPNTADLPLINTNDPNHTTKIQNEQIKIQNENLKNETVKSQTVKQKQNQKWIIQISNKVRNMNNK